MRFDEEVSYYDLSPAPPAPKPRSVAFRCALLELRLVAGDMFAPSNGNGLAGDVRSRRASARLQSLLHHRIPEIRQAAQALALLNLVVEAGAATSTQAEALARDLLYELNQPTP